MLTTVDVTIAMLASMLRGNEGAAGQDDGHVIRDDKDTAPN